VQDRCGECGVVLETYTNEELGLCIVAIETFIHREPGLAAPLMPEILKVVTKYASLVQRLLRVLILSKFSHRRCILE